MRFKVWGIVLALLAGTAVVSWQQAPRAVACSCAIGTAEEYAGYADLVAKGTVVGVEVPENPASSADDATYTLELTEVWKGEPTPTIAVLSAISGASCGIEGIAEGMTITVFARRDEGAWHTNLCSGTGPDGEGLAIAALGDPTPIAPDARPTPSPENTPKPDETTSPGPPSTGQEPHLDDNPGSMTLPLLIIAVAGLIAAAAAWFRE